jgi:hypothetical protein
MRSIRVAPALTIFSAILAFTGTARAQSAIRGTRAEIACRAYPPTTESFKRKLWDGYEISLGPTNNAQADGDNCTAAIYSREGKVVYRTTGFNVTFDENLTGQDFDGDGRPEVVFQTDTGGGNHCCWEYNVISLYPRPHKLFDISEDGADRFEKDAHGKMIIWVRTQISAGNFSMASRPFAERAFRVRDAKMVDATPEFCAWIFSDESRDFRHWTGNLTPENLRALAAVAHPETEDEETASALLERAGQHVFCRQYEAAIADLNLWPAASRAEMEAQFAASMKDDYPDFAAQLAQSQPSK